MRGLPGDLYHRCRSVFLNCSEFDSDAALRAVFVTDELSPFRNQLSQSASKSGRVDRCLALLMEKRLSDGRPVLPLFIATLRDRYDVRDALHDELHDCYTALQLALKQPEPQLDPDSDLTGQSEWNTSAIRDLLIAAFSDEELTTLCFDRFRTVYQDFSSGMSKGQKIQRLMDYCSRHEGFDRLVALVQERNPAQYARFERSLRRFGSPRNEIRGF